jgi:hypothetical protein
MRFDVNTTPFDDWNHPIEGNLNEQWEFGWHQDISNPAKWNFRYRSSASGGPFETSTWVLGPNTNPIELDKGVWYRIEWQFYRLGTDSYNLHMRVYNDLVSTIIPIYNDGNFYNLQGNPVLLSTTPTITIIDIAMTSFSMDISSGSGSNWPPVTATEYLYYGGVCIRSNDWCGAYVSGGP